jgi:hypothetical protein
LEVGKTKSHDVHLSGEATAPLCARAKARAREGLTRRSTTDDGKEAVLARQGEALVRAVQPLPAWQGEKQLRGLQPLPAWQAETSLRGLQGLPAW